MIHLSLWNACNFLMQFIFTTVHILAKMNTAADFLSRLEIDPCENIILKIKEVIPKKPIEVRFDSTGIAQGGAGLIRHPRPTRDPR